MYKLVTLLFLTPFFGFETKEKTIQESNRQNIEMGMYAEEPTSFSSILIIPFDPKMYNSTVDREIAEYTNLSYTEIKGFMRYGIADHIKHVVEARFQTVSLVHLDQQEVASDLGYVYNSIGYKYKPLPEQDIANAKNNEEAAKPLNKLKGSFNKLIKNDQNEREENEESGATIKDGQIHSVVSYGEKYMNTSIHNPNLLKVLSQKYESDLFLFINELDIEEAARGTKTGLAAIAYRRKIKVHYTVFDKSGKELYGGASITYMPSSVNDMNKIINNYFPVLAQNMSDNIPTESSYDVEKQILKEEAEQERLRKEEIEKL